MQNFYQKVDIPLVYTLSHLIYVLTTNKTLNSERQPTSNVIKQEMHTMINAVKCIYTSKFFLDAGLPKNRERGRKKIQNWCAERDRNTKVY